MRCRENHQPQSRLAIITWHWARIFSSLDSNGDGVPDYLEDANGDGLVDDGETNWILPPSGLQLWLLAGGNVTTNSPVITARSVRTERMVRLGAGRFRYTVFGGSDEVTTLAPSSVPEIIRGFKPQNYSFISPKNLLNMAAKFA